MLRWSALGLGIFYGISRQASIKASDKLAAIDAEYKHKSDLIAKAKAEYAKKNAPPQPSGGGKSALHPGASSPLSRLRLIILRQRTWTRQILNSILKPY